MKSITLYIVLLFFIYFNSLEGQVYLQAESIQTITRTKSHSNDDEVRLLAIRDEEINSLLERKELKSIDLSIDIDGNNLGIHHMLKSHLINDQTLIRNKINDQETLMLKGLYVNSYTTISKREGSSNIQLHFIDNKFSLLLTNEYEEISIAYIETPVKKSGYQIYQMTKRRLGPISSYKCPISSDKTINLSSEKNRKSNINSCSRLDLNLFIDYNFLDDYDSEISEALLRLSQVLHSSQEDFAIYNTEFFVREINFISCKDCEPWINSTNASILLSSFDHYIKSIDNTTATNVLFTGNQLDHLFLGIAYSNSLCEDDASMVVQNLPNHVWEQRVILSHELGHVIGAGHDDSVPNIMSSSLNNSNEWSVNSQANIKHFLNSNTCDNDCEIPLCHEITDIEISDIIANSVNIKWQSNVQSPTQVVLLDRLTDEVHTDIEISETFIMIENLKACRDYELIISAYCHDGSYDIKYISMISNRASKGISIIEVEVVNCSVYSFDLNLEIEHQLTEETMVTVEVSDHKADFVIGPNTSSIQFRNITQWGEKNADIVLYETKNKLCLELIEYDMPESGCDHFYQENFDYAKSPFLWKTESSNENIIYHNSFNWKFDDGDRNIYNYGNGTSEPIERTIDGSCMAYMDDDILVTDSYTGMITLYSPVFNLDNYISGLFSLDYLFHQFLAKGSNNSEFKIEAWDGDSWTTIHNGESANCPWNDVWEDDCVTTLSIDVTKYKNSRFQLRFIYSDGQDGKWTGMIALDNFSLHMISPKVGCRNPEALNYNEASNIHVDHLCEYPCAEEALAIDEFPSLDMVYSDVNLILAKGKNRSDISLQAQQAIELLPGLETTNGYEFVVKPTQCNGSLNLLKMRID